jgi:hypothetical protein
MAPGGGFMLLESGITPNNNNNDNNHTYVHAGVTECFTHLRVLVLLVLTVCGILAQSN